MRHRKLPRRRIQRAFVDWMNKADLPFPLTVIHQSEQEMVCRMAGITGAIRIILTHELIVSVERNCELWDVLMWLDCRPKKQGKHYVCASCPPDQPQHENRESFWCYRLFAPLAKWMDVLASARWLLLFHTAPNGSTWARLTEALHLNDHSTILVEKIRVHTDSD